MYGIDEGRIDERGYRVYEDGSYQDERGNYFDANGSMIAEAGLTDMEKGIGMVQVLNGEGYYDERGRFHGRSWLHED